MSLREYFNGAYSDGWDLDVVGATVALALAIVFFPLRFFVSQFWVQAVPVVIGIASGLYLVSRTYTYPDRAVDQWRLSAGTVHALRMSVVVGLASMVFVGTYTGGRTIPFFGVAAVVGTLVFAQVFFARREALRPGAVLAQVVAFALIVRWTALATTPGLIGVDSWVHLPEYAASIRESGQLSAIADSKYFAAPLYHLLVVVAAEAFNSSLRTGLYASLGIVVPLSVLLIYATTRYFLPIRWALFATAAYAVADHVVRWGIHIIPTSMGLVFFVGVFYGVGRIYATRETRATYALVLLFVVATVLTHQISTFVVIVFLGVGAVTQLAARLLAPRFTGRSVRQAGSPVNFPVLFLVALVLAAANWSLTPSREGSFLTGMLDTAWSSIATAGFLNLASARTVGSEAVASLTTAVPASMEVLNGLGFLLLLLVTLVGSFTLLQSEHRRLLPLSWINSTALMLFVTLGLPLFGLYFLIPGRWYAFMYVPMVVIGAYGMSHLEVSVSARQLAVVLVLFALLFPGAMLVTNKATHDDPVGEDYYHRFAYSESELDAAETISAIHPEGTTVRADHPYYIYLRDSEDLDARPLVLNADGAVSGEYVIYREYQAEGMTAVRYPEGDTNVRTQLSADAVCDSSMDVVYTNGEVQYCRSNSER